VDVTLLDEAEREGGPVLTGRERAVARRKLGARLQQFRHLELGVASSAEPINH
jgi:hypothetical protein